MKRLYTISVTCALLMILFVLLAGCTFLPSGNPAQSVTPAGTAAPAQNPVVIQTPEMEVAKTCPEIAGTICLDDEFCSGSLIKTTDSSRCCSGTCAVPTPGANPTAPSAIHTVNPSSTVIQQAIPETPVFQQVPGQTVAPVVSPVVTAAPVQTPEMEIAKTCPEIGGVICLTDETCSGSLIQTTDSSRCCAGTCIVSSYSPVTVTTEPTVIPVVPKTCAEVGGLVCVSPQTCTGGLIKTTDVDKCCAGTCA